MAVPTRLKRSQKYRILGLVGQGQFGQVFCAVHRKTGQMVALKNLDRYRFSTHKFLRELRFLLSLQHPNIVNCQALEHTATGRFLVMDYCEGGTLRQLMETDAPLSLAQKIQLISDVLAGLRHAHSRGIVHCDIKPENVLLTLKPGTWTAHISDFGIARLVQNESLGAASNTGSPAYMAPERFYGQYSLLSDLYAVGVLLYELMLGRRPFSGTPQELMTAHLNQPVVIPEELPKELQDILRHSLQKLPARRFRSAEAMLEALQGISAASLAQAEEILASNSLLDEEGYDDFYAIAHRLSAFAAQQQDSLSDPVVALTSHDVVLGTAIADKNSGTSSSGTLSSTAGGMGAIAPQPGSRFSQHQVRATAHHCSYIRYGTEILPINGSNPQVKATVTTDSPIQSLVPAAEGCFVLTQQSVHFFPWTSMASTRPLVLDSVLRFEQPHYFTVQTTGRWVAAFSAATRQLTTCRWRYAPQQPLTVGNTATTLMGRASQSLQPVQLLPLDQGHGAVVFHQTAATGGRASSIPKTWFQVFTRRGNRLGAIAADLLVSRAIATPTPYRFLALEQGVPEAVLLLDLKPFRARRIPLTMTPTCIQATSWGYLLAADDGELLLLNDDVEVVGRVAGPAHPTAIATFKPSGVLIATWDGQQGQLYTVDLRDLEIDLMF